jgi:hypothetical protein
LVLVWGLEQKKLESVFPHGDGTVSGATNPVLSIVVVINMSDVSSTSLLDRASFHKTTFYPSFLTSLEKKTWVV